jgi:hypothetical protein
MSRFFEECKQSSTNSLSRNKALLLIAEKYSVLSENRKAGEHGLCSTEYLSSIYCQVLKKSNISLVYVLQKRHMPMQYLQLGRLSFPTKKDLVSYVGSKIIRVVPIHTYASSLINMNFCTKHLNLLVCTTKDSKKSNKL